MQTIEAKDWLLQRAPGYCNLSEEEKSSIASFSLLWSLFESQVLSNSASAKAILDAVSEWEKAAAISLEDFNVEIQHFRERYVSDSATNYRFEHLNFRQNDCKELITDVLLGTQQDTSSVLGALLIVVYRYRNNLFHGMKWHYELQGQLENFKIANSILMKSMDICDEAQNAV